MLGLIFSGLEASIASESRQEARLERKDATQRLVYMGKIIIENYGPLYEFTSYKFVDGYDVDIYAASNGDNGPQACSSWYYLVAYDVDHVASVYELKGHCNDTFSTTRIELSDRSRIRVEFFKAKRVWIFENGKLTATHSRGLQIPLSAVKKK